MSVLWSLAIREEMEIGFEEGSSVCVSEAQGFPLVLATVRPGDRSLVVERLLMSMTCLRRAEPVEQSSLLPVAHHGACLPTGIPSRDVRVTLPPCKVQVDPMRIPLLRRRNSRRYRVRHHRGCDKSRTVPVAVV